MSNKTLERGRSSENLRDDGLTRWHGAFLRLGLSLDECATRYRSIV